MSSQPPARGHFRIQYPVTDRPVFVTTSGQQLAVVNVSEAGLNVMADNVDTKVGGAIRGTITFPNGTSVGVVGKILRKTKTRLVIFLDEGVPLPTIMDQQRWLI